MPGYRIQLNEARAIFLCKLKTKGIIVQGIHPIDKVHLLTGKGLQHRFHVLIISKIVFHNHSICAAADKLACLQQGVFVLFLAASAAQMQHGKDGFFPGK